MGTRIRFGAWLVGALVALMIAAAPASAGTTCAVGTTAVFEAADVSGGSCGGGGGPSEVNHLAVGVDATGAVTFTDANPVTAGSGCTANGTTAVCPGTTSYRFDLGAGNDSAIVGSVAASGTSTGGDGNDTLTGGDRTDVLDGGAGDDTVAGGDGSDVLEGDPTSGSCLGSAGSDHLDGGPGDDRLCAGDGPAFGPDADVIAGGAGTDIVHYPRFAAVSVSLDGNPGDGEPGEGDNVQTDVEGIVGGAGNDTLTGDDGPNVLDGGAGGDVLNGGGGPDVLTDSGGDVAADTFNGGDGDDVLADAGAGPDAFGGGGGEDLLTAYAARAGGVSVSLDGQANDGASGEGDNVGTDVEDVATGGGDDQITGDDSDNELSGGAGADTITGGGGNDGLHGGAGADHLDGGPGIDLLDGGAGPDALASRDGQTDRDACGGGTDSVSADGRDDVVGDCENQDIAAPAPVTIRSVVVTRAGFVVVRITCPQVERRCGGTVIVKSVRRVGGRFIRLGQAGYQRLLGGNTNIVRARISARDRRVLRRARRVKVRAIVTNVNPDTATSTSATKLATVSTRGL